MQSKSRIFMQQACSKIVHNDYTIEDLSPWLEIQKTSFQDAPYILPILVEGFGIPNEKEAFRQLLYTNADLNNSVKIVDTRTNEIYGILIFSKYPMQCGSPLHEYSNNLCRILAQYKQINGFAFVLDERLRGRRYDRKMLFFNKEYLESFDFIWCAVEKELKTDNYWKRLGFTEILKIEEATFYLKLINKSILADIYKKIMDINQHEENYN